jgi:hypothetical protein
VTRGDAWHGCKAGETARHSQDAKAERTGHEVSSLPRPHTARDVQCTEPYLVGANPVLGVLGADVDQIRCVTQSRWRPRRSTRLSSDQRCLRHSRRASGLKRVGEPCIRCYPSNSTLGSAVTHLALIRGSSPIRRSETPTTRSRPGPGYLCLTVIDSSVTVRQTCNVAG